MLEGIATLALDTVGHLFEGYKFCEWSEKELVEIIFTK